MLRNYLAAALRNLARNRLYAAINVAGLAMGFTGAILIALFVRDELNYDRWIPGHEQVYLVSEIIELGGMRPIVIPASPAELARWMRQDFPSIDAIARLAPASGSIRRGEAEYSEKIWWADPDIFTVLPLPAIAGDLRTALLRPNAVVLTRKSARKYFGRDDPVGETLEIDREHAMTVAAVIEDLPSNTHLEIQILASGRASFSKLSQSDAKPPPLASGSNAAPGFTYMRLKPGESIQALRDAMPAFIARHVRATPRFSVNFPITAIADIHLDPPRPPTTRASVRTALHAAIAVAALIVLISSINFMNLSTARASRRATEVGVRKAAGAARRHLIVQFIGECVIQAALAAVVAIALVETLLPVFNSLLDRRIPFNYWHDPELIGGVLGLVAFVGVSAGAYPAFVLARMRPASVLRGGDRNSSGSAVVRQGLVILQFAMLIGLISATAVVQQQNRHALRESLAIGDDPILILGTSCSNDLRHAVGALSGVRGTACSRSLPSEPTDTQSMVTSPAGASIPLWHSAVGFGFFELYGLRPVAGRFFEPGRAGDIITSTFADARASVIVNEAAVKALGFRSARAAVDQTIPCFPSQRRLLSNTAPSPCEIVGVVPDYAEDSIREPIPPSIYYLAPEDFRYLSIELDGRDVPGTLAAVEALWEWFGEPRAIRLFFLNEAVQKLYLEIIRQAQLLAAFASAALLIASLGLLGLAVFMAERRTREIGLRKAMGAQSGDISRLLLWQFGKPVLWASLFSWPIAAFYMNHWLQGFSHRIDLHPALFVASTLLALTIALLTAGTHSILVARARPVVALRYE